MDESLRRHIIASHRDSLKYHGHSPHALFWSSREVQEARFRALADIGVQGGDSLLDVGCGFADLGDWLAGQGRDVRYCGLDLSPDLVAEARRLHPEMALLCGEVFALTPGPAFDWVLLSGALNWPMRDGFDYVRRVVRHMFSLCRKGVAFNLLDARHTTGFGRFGLQCFDPSEVMDFCRRLSADCRLVDGYLENDFTIWLRRS